MSNFVHYEFNNAKSGDVIKVEIDTAANVFIVDDNNFRSYRSGGRFEYIGGEQRRSPIKLQIPRPGTWHVVIDLGGRGGKFRHSAVLISS